MFTKKQAKRSEPTSKHRAKRGASAERSDKVTQVLDASIAVDYPQEGERVTSADYTLRVGAPDVEEVDVSIDNAPWQPCRWAEGFWWHDWTNYLDGKHSVSARARTKDGQTLLSRTRSFRVEL